jgi:hypothetical protein
VLTGFHKSGSVALTLAACALSILWIGCSGTAGPQPDEGLARFWSDYSRLPGLKAMALAGNPDYVWVAGAVGGEDSWEEAESAAMKECNHRRHVRRMVDPCRIYARGREIVWAGPRR